MQNHLFCHCNVITLLLNELLSNIVIRSKKKMTLTLQAFNSEKFLELILTYIIEELHKT